MKPILTLLYIFASFNLFAQTKIDSLIKDGVDLHDRGYYEEAIVKYDSALAIDKLNYTAAYEKAYTLMQLKRYDQMVVICRDILDHQQGNKNFGEVYVLYGSALDMLDKKEEAVAMYDKGIKAYPNTSMLYYNKAITLLNMNEVEKAVEATATGLTKKPLHASSHKVIFNTSKQTNKTLSLLSGLVFLAIEPQGDRAIEVRKAVESLLTAEAKKTGDNSYSVDLDPSVLLAAGKKKENNFASADMILSLNTAMNVEEKYKNETQIERFQRNLKTIISVLKEGQKEGKGFGWQFYVPFFISLEKDSQTETLSHIFFATADDPANNSWLSQNKEKVDAFYNWLKAYQWPLVKQ